ncbi:MAG: L-lactate permease [candidate division NC10 bacterium]|jgi:L-lactate transport
MWLQVYSPVLHSVNVSCVVALLPIALIFILLGGFRKPAPLSTGVGLLSALALAVTVWRMPLHLAVASTLMGMAVAIVPLLWTLINAVWLINLLIDSGHFTVIKESIGYITRDRRIQALLIGFGFIGLLEGLVAIGSPVAIGTPILVGLGFPPITAGIVAILSFSHPGVWGPMGLPIIVLHSVTTGIDLDALGAMIGRLVPLLTLFTAPAVVMAVSGWRGLREVWGITVVTGVVFAVSTFVTSNYLTLYMAGIVGALAGMVTTIGALSVWKPKTVWRFPGEPVAEVASPSGTRLSWRQVTQAWSPIGLLILVMGLVNATPLREKLASLSTFTFEWPGLHNIVWKTTPIVATPEPYGAVYSYPLLVVPGTLALITGLLSIAVLRIPPARAFRVYTNTVRQLSGAIRTTLYVIGLGFLMNYAGLSLTIGVAFSAAGFWFPLVAVFLGVLGTALTGTNTASNALFGNLVAVAGSQADIPAVFAAAALAGAGGMGKAIAPQSLALATGAGGIQGQEGDLFRRLVGVTLILSVAIGAFAMIVYYVFPWMIP